MASATDSAQATRIDDDVDDIQGMLGQLTLGRKRAREESPSPEEVEMLDNADDLATTNPTIVLNGPRHAAVIPSIHLRLSELRTNASLQWAIENLPGDVNVTIRFRRPTQAPSQPCAVDDGRKKKRAKKAGDTNVTECDTSKSTCAHCNSPDHRIGKCPGPTTDLGDMLICPFCEKAHPVDMCKTAGKASLQDLYQRLLIDRTNLPPIRTTLSVIQIAITLGCEESLTEHMPLSKWYVRRFHLQRNALPDGTKRDPRWPTDLARFRRCFEAGPDRVQREIAFVGEGVRVRGKQLRSLHAWRKDWAALCPLDMIHGAVTLAKAAGFDWEQHERQLFPWKDQGKDKDKAGKGAKKTNNGDVEMVKGAQQV